MPLHQPHHAAWVIEHAPLDRLLQQHAQDAEHVVHRGGLAMPQRELQLLHVLIGDVVESLLAERREQLVLEHQLLVGRCRSAWPGSRAHGRP